MLSAFQLKAQHDMNNMPGMKMPAKKVAETKKPVSKSESGSPAQKVIYTCPMHPEVKSDKPGNCPKCGMKLVKKTVKATPSKTVSTEHNGMNMDMGNMKMDKNKPMDNSMNMGDMKMRFLKVRSRSLNSEKSMLMNKSREASLHSLKAHPMD